MRTSKLPSRKDQAFVRAPNHSFGGDLGYLYTAHSIDREFKARRSVAIKLTTSYKPIEIQSGKNTDSYLAAAIKPLVPRHLRGKEVGLVTVVLNPRHPKFRNISTMPGPNIVRLDRMAFASLDAELTQAYLGNMQAEGALALLEKIVACTVRQLPEPLPLDPRVSLVIDYLQTDISADLPKLAAKIRLSSYRLSHLFSEQMGMSLRSYQLWRKIDTAWRYIGSDRSIQEIAMVSGFADVAHFCKIFRDAYGVPVSYVLNKVDRRTKVS